MDDPKIISALIGLCGAIGNNGKTEETDRIVMQALLSADSEEMVGKIHKEKFTISPNCATCQFPCGNTSDYDMERFYDATPEEIQSKLELLGELKRLMRRLQNENGTRLPDTVYQAIAYLGYGLSADSYQKLTEELKHA